MRPAPALLWLLLGWTALAVLASFERAWLPAWALSGGLLAVLAALDGWRGRRQPVPAVERRIDPVLPLGPEAEVTLRLAAGATRTQRLTIHDGHPPGWAVRGQPQRLVLPAGSALDCRYRLRPDARGAFDFGPCALALDSPWRLWRVRRQAGTGQGVKVYPNFSVLAELAGLSVELASFSVGARLQRRRGEGTEFEELRDYRVGDSLRKVDWKATARSGRLISREYRDERNQQVVLMLDCGRRLLAQDGRLAHFDHVLNAVLALAAIALRQGDAVGLMALGAGQPRWLPPQQGAGGIDVLLDAAYDLEAQPVAIDYLAAGAALMARQRRRALVVFVTNVRDEDDQDLHAAVEMLARRHLVVVASLREAALDAALARPGPDLDDAIRAASALHYLDGRENVHAALRGAGVNTLDVAAAELSGSLIERYLAIKRSNRL